MHKTLRAFNNFLKLCGKKGTRSNPCLKDDYIQQQERDFKFTSSYFCSDRRSTETNGETDGEMKRRHNLACTIKGTVHQKLRVLSSCTYNLNVWNLYVAIFSIRHQMGISLSAIFWSHTIYLCENRLKFKSFFTNNGCSVFWQKLLKVLSGISTFVISKGKKTRKISER